MEGEIAVRILRACRELPTNPPPTTFALYTPTDKTHLLLGRPTHALEIPSPASYTDIDFLVRLVKENAVDAVHPGYGFLSENAEFARRIWEDTEGRAVVVGPGWEVLEETGDKLRARRLAEGCGVPVLPALGEATENVEAVRRFAREVGLPIMVKAVDGGGGRAIRLVREEAELESAVRRALGESPSKRVFAEKAAVDGFRHIEVQILGEGNGRVQHLWERDCSVQRRFQKIVEVAPAQTKNRKAVVRAIDGALRMARKVKYLGLGTWEFLLNVDTAEFFFLEINPRLQVEHTITESITSVDLVTTQLLLAQGSSLQDIGIPEAPLDEPPPQLSSIQLRVCAEDPTSDFALSIGKIAECHFPNGIGIRVETHISNLAECIVGSDFDNLVAKIVVTGRDWNEMLRRSRRALEDTRIIGVKTNTPLLRAVLENKDFVRGSFDNRWLESRLLQLVKHSSNLQEPSSEPTYAVKSSNPPTSTAVNLASASTSFRKGDAWSLELSSIVADAPQQKAQNHHLVIDRLLRNDFPDLLEADITYTSPGDPSPSREPYRLVVNSTKTSAQALATSHRKGDPANKNHLLVPLSGKLIEILVEEGDIIGINQVVAFIKQMKMELEIRSPRSGTVKWVFELEDEVGDDVAEGTLLAEIEDEAQLEERPNNLKGRL
ncbi:MAG: hypothetical protein Q9227_000946 [Pyrenula ochraceoflavens]